MTIILISVSIGNSLNVYDIVLISVQFSLIKWRRVYVFFRRRSNFAKLIFMIVDEFIKRITNAGLSTQRYTSPNRRPLSWPELFRIFTFTNVYLCLFHILSYNKIIMEGRDRKRKKLKKRRGGEEFADTKCICVEVTNKRMHIFQRNMATHLQFY